MIPVNQPIITRKDATSVYKAVKDGWISSSGPHIKKFESELASFVGKKYCSAVSSGTAALDIAVKVLNLKKNDEIILPNFTIISNVLSILKQGLKPILVDCDPKNWNLKIDDIEKKITKKTKAIMAVHIYGYPLEIDKVVKICKKHKLYLIEDSAEMIGHSYKKKKCGSYGDISTFSFYANKHITTGEGGAVLTNSKKFDLKIKSLRNLSFGKKNRYNHDDFGWNYRLSNLQAALGLSQLKRIKSIVKRKIEIGKYYYSLLGKNKNIYIQKPVLGQCQNIYWVVGVVIKDKKILAEKLKKKLKNLGIDTRSFFWPINKQKIIKKMKIKFNSKYPNSEYLAKYGFYLPSGVGITNKEIEYICSKLNKII